MTSTDVMTVAVTHVQNVAHFSFLYKYTIIKMSEIFLFVLRKQAKCDRGRNLHSPA